jgi:hypothetical protein
MNAESVEDVQEFLRRSRACRSDGRPGRERTALPARPFPVFNRVLRHEYDDSEDLILLREGILRLNS